MLSSLVLGGITFGYSAFSTYIATARANEDLKRRLQTEIDLRFVCYLDPIIEAAKYIEDQEREKKPVDEGPALARHTALSFHVFFDEPKAIHVLQPEFSNRSLTSLLAGYLVLCKDPVEATNVEHALSSMARAAAAQDRTEGSVPAWKILSTIDDVYSGLFNGYLEWKWRHRVKLVLPTENKANSIQIIRQLERIGKIKSNRQKLAE